MTGKLLGGWIGTTENFIRIGHTLFALLAGWFGGQLSSRIGQSFETARRINGGALVTPRKATLT